MEGLKQAIEKIEEMAQKENTQIFDIHGGKYSTEKLIKIEKDFYSPRAIELNTLKSLVEIIKTEIDKAFLPLFIRVVSPDEVEVFSTYHDEERYCKRDYLYSASAELPQFSFNSFIEHENFMISLRSKFIETEDVDYLLTLLASITDKNSVECNDDGITQTVQAKKGVVMVQNVNTKPKVILKPFRTFLEIEQPSSEFLLRLKEGGYVALFEADGGAWRLEAKKYIKEYLETALCEHIEVGEVVVIA
mgnify:CR=1 FL=1